MRAWPGGGAAGRGGSQAPMKESANARARQNGSGMALAWHSRRVGRNRLRFAATGDSLNGMADDAAQSPIQVRPMVPGDVPRCAAIVGATPLWSERYGVTEQRAMRLFETAFERKEGLLVAETEHVLGFAWFLLRGGFGRSGYLRLIGVYPARRGAGAGALLLAAVEAAVGDDLVVLVADFNAGAQRFYERHGYREVGRLPGYVLPEVEEIIYWRRK